MNTSNMVEIELPEQYLDTELRAGSELSFAGEMICDLLMNTGTAIDEKPNELLSVIMEDIASYFGAEYLITAWNKTDAETKIREASETETTLKTELLELQQQNATMQTELKALRTALYLLRNACKESKAKGITQTLQLISKVA